MRQSGRNVKGFDGVAEIRHSGPMGRPRTSIRGMTIPAALALAMGFGCAPAPAGHMQHHADRLDRIILILSLDLCSRDASRHRQGGTRREWIPIIDHYVDCNNLKWEVRKSKAVEKEAENEALRREKEAGGELALPKGHPVCRASGGPFADRGCAASD